ncbi:MAG TPA: hypothetical protein PKM02_09495 [Candidatus Fermentibacter daniensis]|jgi:hypothetical protein|nr:hypothetical protein [Candidatus Fermentibacter daniensis]
MKVRLVLIPPDDLSSISDMVEQLRKAVDKGDMDALDTSTEELIASTAAMMIHDLDIEDWRNIIDDYRLRKGQSGADYLVPVEMYHEYFPGSSADAAVLQIPYDEQEFDGV